MISKNQPSLSEDAEKMSFSNKDGSEPLGSVSSQLFLKSSAQSLDKDVVLRRLRHHKTMSKVKNAFQAMLAPRLANTEEPYEEKWLQKGDSFTSPWRDPEQGLLPPPPPGRWCLRRRRWRCQFLMWGWNGGRKFLRIDYVGVIVVVEWEDRNFNDVQGFDFFVCIKLCMIESDCCLIIK